MMTNTVETGRGSQLMWRTVPGVAALAALAVTACAPEETAEFQEGESTPTQQSAEEQTPDETADSGDEDTAEVGGDADENGGDSQGDGDDQEAIVAEVDEPVTFEECEDAEDSDDATVTWLDDVVYPEETLAEAAPAETIEIDGAEVELPGAPAVVIPERVGQAGCIIEYDAPGGCISGFDISEAYIPGYAFPERTMTQVELSDGTSLDELVQDELTVDAVEIDSISADQVCQDDEDAEAGDTVWGVTRWGETRWGETQWGETRWGETRWAENTETGDRTPTMQLDSYSTDPMSIDSVSVDSESLETYQLDGAEHTDYSQQEESISYTTEGDVLFDSDEYELRADAGPELEAIAEDIAERDDDFVIEVEGHTDDLPTSVYDDNYELSELRAQSVVDWLTENADVAEESISAEGLGEDYPRADNATDEGRQENRRVVITVQPEDYEPEVDYDLEDAEE